MFIIETDQLIIIPGVPIGNYVNACEYLDPLYVITRGTYARCPTTWLRAMLARCLDGP